MRPTKGEWSLPKTDNTNLTSAIMESDTDVEVEVSTRKGFEEGRLILKRFGSNLWKYRRGSS